MELFPGPEGLYRLIVAHHRHYPTYELCELETVEADTTLHIVKDV